MIGLKQGFCCYVRTRSVHCAAILLFESRRSSLASFEFAEQLVGLVFWGNGVFWAGM